MSAAQAVTAGAAAYLDSHGRLIPERVRGDFPILARELHGRPLVYLDTGASSQQPHAVLDAVAHYTTTTHANVHRGVHGLSQAATTA